MKNDIIYIRGRSEEHTELIAAFKKRGFHVHIVREMSDACALARKKLPAACILDASSSEAEVSERVIELTRAEELYSRPMIFFGKRVTEHYHPVQQEFRRYLAIDYPFKLDRLLDSFSKQTEELEEGELTPQQTAHSLSFTDPSKIGTGRGGVFLLHANSLDAFDDDVLLPAHPQKANLQKALSAMTEVNNWLGLHARRTTYLSSALAHSHKLSEADQRIRTSALMLNWSLARGGDKALSFDFFSDEAPEYLKKIAAAFRSSASVVAEKIEDADSANVIEHIAQILSRDAAKLSEEERRVAECVILAEASDRACWRFGRFNHFGANRAIRSLRDTNLIETKDLKDGMGRVVAEAVLHQDPDVNAFRKVLTRKQKASRRAALEGAQRDATALYGATATKEVQIFNLLVGMQLAEPLVSVDGKVILPASTVMDDDSIMRVFQLAAVRPLLNPVVVVRKA